MALLGTHSTKVAALVGAMTLLSLGGCKNRGKKGDSDAPDDGESAAVGKSGKSGDKTSRSADSDSDNQAGEGEPGSRGRNRNANSKDLVYLAVDGERCDRSNKREHQVDVNQDGYADLVTLYTRDATGDKIACKQADLNFDGRLDAFIHYAANGEVEREQYDQDFDGRIDTGRYYQQGKLARDEIDLNQDGFADSWRIYDEGRLIRVETDRDADGRADMFTYYVGKQIDRIGYDVNGDGKVDTWDHDAARRARLALQKRRAPEAAKPEADAYVEEKSDEEGKDGKDAKEGNDAKEGKDAKKSKGKDEKPEAKKPKSK